jgi:uncharacterized membrane protein
MITSKRKGLFDKYRGIFRAIFAFAILVALLALIITGLCITGADTTPTPEAQPGQSNDLALYNRIIEHVQNGESYYTAAIGELRNSNYPVRPFVAVRYPAHALAMAALPNESARQLALYALVVMTFAAWAWRLSRQTMSPTRYALTLLALASGIAPALTPNAYPLHDVWAGLLIALSLALRSPERWLASILIGLSAALIRELAAPYLLAMALFAILERNRREAYGWLTAIAIFVALYAVHAIRVNELVTATDLASPGWLKIGGWQFVLQTTKMNLLLLATPSWLAAILVPFSLLGFSIAREPLDRRIALIVAGYICAFVFLGRTSNFYWGFIVAPLLPMGLVTAWPTLSQHMTNIRQLLRNIYQRTLRIRDA